MLPNRYDVQKWLSSNRNNLWQYFESYILESGKDFHLNSVNLEIQ